MKPSGQILLTLLFISFSLNACSGTKDKNATGEKTETESQTAEQLNIKYYTELDANELLSAKSGDTINVVAGDSLRFNLKVQSSRTQLKNITTISAVLGSKEAGLASLLIDEGRVSGTINLYGDDRIYYVRYDSLKPGYYLDPVLKKEQDILEGSEPLIKNGSGGS